MLSELGDTRPQEGEQAAPRREPMFVSVIIPARNAERYVGFQIEALSRQLDVVVPFEVILVDNGSTDGTVHRAKRAATELEHFRVVHANARSGVCYARNVGARAAVGDLLLYCDADDIVDNRWLSEMVCASQHFDVIGGYRDIHRLNRAEQRSWRRPPPTDGLPLAFNAAPFAPGSNFGIWRDVLETIGGWDERLAYGGDDLEISFRAARFGFTLGFAKRAVVYYRLRDSLVGTTQQLRSYARGASIAAHLHALPMQEPITVWNLLKRAVWLALRCPYILLPRRRIVWVRQFSTLVGHIEGRWMMSNIPLSSCAQTLPHSKEPYYPIDG